MPNTFINTVARRLVDIINKPPTTPDQDRFIIGLLLALLISVTVTIGFSPYGVFTAVGFFFTGIGLIIPLTERTGDIELSKNEAFAFSAILGLGGLSTTCISMLLHHCLK